MDIWRTTVPNSNMSSGGGRDSLDGLNPEWLNHLWPGMLGSVTLTEDLRDWVHGGWVPFYNNALAFTIQLRKITDYRSQVQVSKNSWNPCLEIDVVSKMGNLQIIVNFLVTKVCVPRCITQNVQTLGFQHMQIPNMGVNSGQPGMVYFYIIHHRMNELPSTSMLWRSGGAWEIIWSWELCWW